VAGATLIGQLKLLEGILHPQPLVVANANGGFPGGRSFPLSISPKDIESEGIMPLCKGKAELQRSLFIEKNSAFLQNFFLC